MRPESLGLVEELIFGRDFCRKTVAIGRPKNGVSEGIDCYNARYACDMQKLRFRFLLSGHLVGDFDSPIPRFGKNGVFLCGSTDRSRSGYSLSLLGKSVPMTILVKAKIQKNCKM